MNKWIGFWLGCLGLLLLQACKERLSHDQRNKAFELKSPGDCGIGFQNQLRESDSFNIIQYLYYYNGGGVAVVDIDADGLQDLFFTGNQTPNRLYRNLGNWQFDDITVKSGILNNGQWSTGISVTDVNGDNLPDLYVCQVGGYKYFDGRNQLYINKGGGQFEEQAAQWGLDFKGLSTQAGWLDFDLDGDLDCYLLNHSVHGTEAFGDSSLRRVYEPISGDRFFRNDGEHFTDITLETGIFSGRIGYGLGIGIADLDQNGYPDLYISNDFRENDYCYLNQGNGTFREVIQQAFACTSMFSMGNDLADINNDGWVDVLTLDMKPEDEVVLKSSVGPDNYNFFQQKTRDGFHYQYPRNMLQLSRGVLPGLELTFSETGQMAGLDATDWSWSALCADWDLDGLQDVFISNGIWRRPNDLDYLKFISGQQVQSDASDLELAAHMPAGLVENYIFQQQKDQVFKNTAVEWGLDLKGCSNGAAYGDLDNDGDLDLVLNNLNAPASLFENRQDNKHWLQIKTNFQNQGLKAWLYAGGAQQYRELYTVRGFQSASQNLLHFGLGEIQVIDSLILVWADGSKKVWRQLPVDQLIHADKTVADGKYSQSLTSGITPELNLLPENKTPAFFHRENEYVDFDIEKLLLQKNSTQGPALAIADINNDGLSDCFLGGAKGFKSKLFLQNKNGSWKELSQPAFEQDQIYEEVAATWLDADQDGDLDLYVVSGSGEVSNRETDRLYLQGPGLQFTKAPPDWVPGFPVSGSCVVAADFDGDGRTDIFRGSRSIPGQYGKTPPSILLWNEGGGRFSIGGPPWIPVMMGLGMVTSAAWLPELKQLAVAGTWMPLMTIGFNGRQPAGLAKVPQSSGWWSAITAADLDGDGDLDLLAGNLGLNSDLQASATEPLRLYLQDFDKNGATDPIMTYFRQGREVTFWGKDELTAQMPGLRKKYNDYAGFAEAAFGDIWDSTLVQQVQLLEVQQLASGWWEQQQGAWRFHPFPAAAQAFPIAAFGVLPAQKGHPLRLLAAGNFTDFQPAIGRMEAGLGVMLAQNAEGTFLEIPFYKSGWAVKGEVRQIAVSPEGNIFVARNGARPLIFQPATVEAE